MILGIITFLYGIGNFTVGFVLGYREREKLYKAKQCSNCQCKKT